MTLVDKVWDLLEAALDPGASDAELREYVHVFLLVHHDKFDFLGCRSAYTVSDI